MGRRKNVENRDPLGVQPCGFKCFTCPFEDCYWNEGDSQSKAEMKRRVLLKKFELQTYPALEWKYRPRHLT